MKDRPSKVLLKQSTGINNIVNNKYPLKRNLDKCYQEICKPYKHLICNKEGFVNYYPDPGQENEDDLGEGGNIGMDGKNDNDFDGPEINNPEYNVPSSTNNNEYDCPKCDDCPTFPPIASCPDCSEQEDLNCPICIPPKTCPPLECDYNTCPPQEECESCPEVICPACPIIDTQPVITTEADTIFPYSIYPNEHFEDSQYIAKRQTHNYFR
jgi:hypothetical protein